MRTSALLLVLVVAPIGLVTIEPDPNSSTSEPVVATTPAPAAEVVHEVSPWPAVTVVGADADQLALLGRALDKFRDFGLELPDVEVRYSDDEADCNGHLGIFENSYTPWRLSVCEQLPFVVYHELAHAWEAANVDDDTRKRYLEARGLATWNGQEAPHEERGVEDAARVIQFHVMTSHPVLSSPIWQERLAAYELLVGRPSPLATPAEGVGGADEGVGVDHDAAGSDDTGRTSAGPSEAGGVLHPTSFVALSEVEPVATLDAEPICVSSSDPTALRELFDLGDPIIGADYQRAFALPDGRVLWLFQDAFLPTSSGPELVHNAGLLQSGRCFQLLGGGSADAPVPYLFPDLTDRFDRWFWPLGGDIGLDGNLYVFVAEMRERGAGYLVHTEPVATWLVSIELDGFQVVDARPAPNPSPDLYGWSVVSEGTDTFLYAHCYRQFGWDVFPYSDPPVRTHDRSCGPDVTVARIPRSDFDADPEYWDGSAWTTDPGGAVPVMPRDGRSVNPTQVALHDGRFVAVTKVDDWWGATIHLDVAPAAEGPWRTYATIPGPRECDRCNSYFASVVPYGADDGSFWIGVSINTWGGDDLAHYAPMFLTVPAPPGGRNVVARRPGDHVGAL